MIVKVLLATTALLLGAGPAQALRLPTPCLMLEQGWVRAPVAGRDMTAAYGRLHNNCKVAVALRLDKLSSLQADKVELHRTEVVDGVSRMRPATELVIAPGGHAVLEPGGLHLMLHGLTPDVQVGSEVVLWLEDQEGRVRRPHLPVRAR